jgi:hypothetical protein
VENCFPFLAIVKAPHLWQHQYVFVSTSSTARKRHESLKLSREGFSILVTKMNELIVTDIVRRFGRPRFKKSSGIWCCMGPGEVAFGATFLEAWGHYKIVCSLFRP